MEKRKGKKDGAPLGTDKQNVTVDDNISWLSDSRMNPEKRPCRFLRMEEEDKPGWNDISTQGSKFKSYWASWESMVVNQENPQPKLFVDPRACHNIFCLYNVTKYILLSFMI